MAGRWYHGSQRELAALRTGSSITEHVAIARAFSHRPRLVSIADQQIVELRRGQADRGEQSFSC